MTRKGQDLLENAYRLETPADNVNYYRAFSETYDEAFAGALGFALPRHVAERFRELWTDNGLIADVGCGTGLLGEELRDQSLTIHGLDISSEMLTVAERRGVYSELHVLDLAADVGELRHRYRAVVSSGTFTHGHLGTDAFLNTIELGSANCLFVLSINRNHYKALGFQDALQKLDTADKIQALELREVDIYDKGNHAHSGDRALIVSFRLT